MENLIQYASSRTISERISLTRGERISKDLIPSNKYTILDFIDETPEVTRLVAYDCLISFRRAEHEEFVISFYTVQDGWICTDRCSLETINTQDERSSRINELIEGVGL